MTQKDALDILKMGKNVFITGPAGSGKTFVVNEYIKFLREHDVAIGITASTGIAATHMGGVTIHSWSGMGVKDDMNEYELEELLEKKYVTKKVQSVHVLIIDEISMLHHYRLDLLDKIMRKIRRKDMSEDRPFGGVQIVLCGDFFQLPPVRRAGEPEAYFAYRSKAWQEANFVICYLSEQHRQKDDISIHVLNEIRSGSLSEKSLRQIQTRFNAKIDDSVQPTSLYTHNADVDGINDQEIDKIEGNYAVYEMTSKGKKAIVETLKKTCLAPQNLRLKKGARVMCVKNNFDKGYVNGTLGVVVSCGWGIDPVIQNAKGEQIRIERASWVIEDNGRIIAEINQYPLRLAWAITVHKSQGMSLDAVEVDLSKSFELGMGYVALSRVRNFNGLKILGLNEHALKVHPDILEHDILLRKQSDMAEQRLKNIGREEISRVQKQFLAKIAPLHSFEIKETLNKISPKIKKEKKKKINTYEKTALLIQDKKSLEEIAKARKLNRETIISHIDQLVHDGYNVDIKYLKSEISHAHFAKIKSVLQEIYDEKGKILLFPVKDRLGPNYSYAEIKLVRALTGLSKYGVL
jgi:ATP-dependent exoDNAse (exonuclease V) alpha subunit